MNDDQRLLPKPYHEAVMHWQRHNFPDYPRLERTWDTFFPKDEPFCLCARIERGMPDLIQVGDLKGQPKALSPERLAPEAAHELLGIIRAQASTEFGSIQQHQPTLERAPDPQDQAWVLRVMAEELRHGYQMVHLLTSADWSSVTDQRPADMVDEILSMRTGSHVLAAFNLEYDSFIDNIVFAAFIDRVGKYQLTMQKVCAYQPMATSMPPMLREEAFHLAAGVVPMRRWAEKAATGEGLVSMEAMQRAIAKWFPRAMEMFGDERGGNTNVKFGLKDMANREAQSAYIEECERMLDDINQRYVRARFPELDREAADTLYQRVKTSKQDDKGLRYEELLRLPDRRFFRRRGEPAFQMIGRDGETFTDVGQYVAHCVAQLPEAYRASIDVRHWSDLQRQVIAGSVSLRDAISSLPRLARVGGACPCASSVRWVTDAPSAPDMGTELRLHQ